MSYAKSVRHICTLPAEIQSFDLPPTIGFFGRLLLIYRECVLPSLWHHGSVSFIRSYKTMNMERKRQVESGYWFVWHPYSGVKFCWDCLAMVTTFLGLLYMPMQVFQHCPNLYHPFIIFSDAISLMDICSKFITGYKDDAFKEVVLEPWKIARNYLRGTFIFDLISILPLRFIVIFPNCTYPTHTVLYIFKLFILPTLRTQFRNLQRQIGLSYSNAVFTALLFRTIIFYHWMTCMKFQVAVFCAHFYRIEGQLLSWMTRCGVYPINNYTLYKYLKNLYTVCSLSIGAGHYSPLDEHLIPRMLITSTIGILGLVYIAYTLSRILRLLIFGRFAKYVYNGRMLELEKYMLVKGLPNFLQQKICLFINHKFYDQFFNEAAIVGTINEQIQQDINMHCCKRLVTNVPLFQDLPVALVNTIIFSLMPVLLMPGQIVMKCTEPATDMYMIFSGTVAVIDSTGREIAHVSDGAYFGLNGLLKPASQRTVTVIALEISKLYKLSYQSFQWCLQRYPHLKRRIEEYARKGQPIDDISINQEWRRQPSLQ